MYIYKRFQYIACCLKRRANNPCSNRPVKCDLCVDSVVWSYGLELHQSEKHEGIACPIIVSDEDKKVQSWVIKLQQKISDQFFFLNKIVCFS